MSTLAIIGGTGLDRLSSRFQLQQMTETTAFGQVSLYKASHSGGQVIFLPRHGDTHSIAPHQVNYRANVLALKQLGVRRIVATNAVGSLRLDLAPGTIAILDDFIDMTRGRHTTLWDEDESAGGTVMHTDFSQPYCPQLRGVLISAAASSDEDILERATYVCAEGPRFESPAEVRMFAQIGGDVVGMTGLPEAVFAREAGMCYAGIAIVTNFGAGLTSTPLKHEAVVLKMAEKIEIVQSIILDAAGRISTESCSVCPVS